MKGGYCLVRSAFVQTSGFCFHSFFFPLDFPVLVSLQCCFASHANQEELFPSLLGRKLAVTVDVFKRVPAYTKRHNVR